MLYSVYERGWEGKAAEVYYYRKGVASLVDGVKSSPLMPLHVSDAPD